MSFIFVSSSGEDAHVAVKNKILLLCTTALHLPIHPSASVYSHVKIRPAKQIHYVFVHTIMICGSIFPSNFTEYTHRILLSSQISSSAVSIQYFLFDFLISLSVCFCFFYIAFQLLHLTIFCIFFSTPCAYCLSYSLLYNPT